MKPDTIEEAAQAIIEAFGAEELREWLLLPEMAAKRMAHFGLSMWIRNHWIHCDEKAGFAVGYMGFPCFGGADEISGQIAHDVWRYLNSLPAISRRAGASHGLTETMPWERSAQILTWD